MSTLTLHAISNASTIRRTPISHRQRIQSLRAKVAARFGNQCFYCGTTLGGFATLDHLTPTARGGERLSEHNAVPSCHNCNNRKGCMTLEEYRWHVYSLTPAGRCRKGLLDALQASRDAGSDVLQLALRITIKGTLIALMRRFPPIRFRGELLQQACKLATTVAGQKGKPQCR